MTEDEKKAKIKHDEAVVRFMIGIYCNRQHHTKKRQLCPECEALAVYTVQRTEHCPRTEEKTFCSSCPIHCYKPEMRAKIKAVMKFSGPRMMLYGPSLCFKHIKNTIKYGKTANPHKIR